MTRTPTLIALEDRLFDLEQLVQSWDDLAYAIADDGTGHPPWIDTLQRHVRALREAHEALTTPSQEATA